MIRFFIVLLVAAFAILGIVFWGIDQGWIAHKPSFLYITLIFLLFSTGLIFGYLYGVDKPGFFTQFYLLSMVVKLLAYCAYNFLMVLKDKPGAFMNVVFFMLVYFIFTMLEVGFLYQKIVRKTKP